MKNFSKTLLSSLLTASLTLNVMPTASADETTAPSDTTPKPDTPGQLTEILPENVSFQYISTVYNGKEQKPAVTVKSGETVLAENTDFVVTYPSDCTNAGKKTITIKGAGNYSGSLSATYMIEPLDCSEKNSGVSVIVPNCFYTGMPLMPEVTVTVNGMTLGGEDFIIAFSDNVDITTDEKKAKCGITFRGNYSGSRTVGFDIAKAQQEDIGILLPVRPGERAVFDLNALLPAGASFGTPDYIRWEYPSDGIPKVAFNELSFTLRDDFSGDTAITVPVINSDSYEDYSIVIYPTAADKLIPTVSVKSPDREYNGEPITADVFASNGSYAAVDGKRIEGEWEFREEPPVLPCSKVPCVLTFTPNDPRYSRVDTVVFITISRIKMSDLKIKPQHSEISVWQPGQLVVSGIPEDYKGTFTLSCGDEKINVKEVPCDDVTQREFEVDFPMESGKYTFKAELSGDGIYLPASSQCSIIVGDYVPPEDKPSDKLTTAEELAALIASAAEESTVKAEGMRSVPSELVKSAADKRLTLEVKLNSRYTWIIDTARLPKISALDLDITTAVIPAVLLNKVGGENLCSFNAFAGGLGNAAKLRVTDEYKKDTFANLFLYSTSGELKFISCAPVGTDGGALLDIGASGKFAVMIDSETKLPGDANNDCKINVLDAIRMIELIMEEYPDYKSDIGKSDLNGDGTLDVRDVVLLVNSILEAN